MRGVFRDGHWSVQPSIDERHRVWREVVGELNRDVLARGDLEIVFEGFDEDQRPLIAHPDGVPGLPQLIYLETYGRINDRLRPLHRQYEEDSYARSQASFVSEICQWVLGIDQSSSEDISPWIKNAIEKASVSRLRGEGAHEVEREVEVLFFYDSLKDQARQTQQTLRWLVKDYRTVARLVEVCSRELPGFSRAHDVTSFPTVVFLRDGEVLKRFTGRPTWTELEAVLTSVVDGQ